MFQSLVYADYSWKGNKQTNGFVDVSEAGKKRALSRRRSKLLPAEARVSSPEQHWALSGACKNAKSKQMGRNAGDGRVCAVPRSVEQGRCRPICGVWAALREAAQGAFAHLNLNGNYLSAGAGWLAGWLGRCSSLTQAGGGAWAMLLACSSVSSEKQYRGGGRREAGGGARAMFIAY